MEIKTSYQSYIPSQAINISQDKVNTLDKHKLKEAAQGMEAEFLKVFLKQSKKIMFINEENKQNKAPGKDIMTDYMFERLAEQMAKTSPFGISDMIIKDVESKSSNTNVLNSEEITADLSKDVE